MQTRIGRSLFCLAALSAALIGCVHFARKTPLSSAASLPARRTLGPAGAKVVLIEFSDFQCPSCKRAGPAIKELIRLYPQDLNIVYKYYPLTNIHPRAMAAAIFAECAGGQGQFWPFHDILFDKQDEWIKSPDAKESFFQYAQELGLSRSELQACVDDPKTENTVKADVAEGDQAGINSTPTFLLGQFRLVGAGQLRRDGARLIEVTLNENRKKK